MPLDNLPALTRVSSENDKVLRELYRAMECMERQLECLLRDKIPPEECPDLYGDWEMLRQMLYPEGQ